MPSIVQIAAVLVKQNPRSAKLLNGTGLLSAAMTHHGWTEKV